MESDLGIEGVEGNPTRTHLESWVVYCILYILLYRAHRPWSVRVIVNYKYLPRMVCVMGKSWLKYDADWLQKE